MSVIFTVVDVTFERDTLAPECEHQLLQKQGAVGGVPASQRCDAWREPDFRGCRCADVLGEQLGMFLGSWSLTY